MSRPQTIPTISETASLSLMLRAVTSTEVIAAIAWMREENRISSAPMCPSRLPMTWPVPDAIAWSRLPSALPVARRELDRDRLSQFGGLGGMRVLLVSMVSLQLVDVLPS